MGKNKFVAIDEVASDHKIASVHVAGVPDRQLADIMRGVADAAVARGVDLRAGEIADLAIALGAGQFGLPGRAGPTGPTLAFDGGASGYGGSDGVDAGGFVGQDGIRRPGGFLDWRSPDPRGSTVEGLLKRLAQAVGADSPGSPSRGSGREPDAGTDGGARGDASSDGEILFRDELTDGYVMVTTSSEVYFENKFGDRLEYYEIPPDAADAASKVSMDRLERRASDAGVRKGLKDAMPADPDSGPTNDEYTRRLVAAMLPDWLSHRSSRSPAVGPGARPPDARASGLGSARDTPFRSIRPGLWDAPTRRPVVSEDVGSRLAQVVLRGRAGGGDPSGPRGG